MNINELMIVRLKRDWYLLGIILVIFTAAAACGAGMSTSEESAEVISTDTSQPSLTSTPETTATMVPSMTPTRTATPTLEPLVARVIADAYCRTGPGTTFQISDYLPQGYEADLAGITEVPREEESFSPELWYVIPRPSDGELCWVFHTVVEVNGDLDSVALVSSPPTITPDPTEGPTAVANALLYFLILKDTGGPVGCGDSLIAVNSGVARGRTVEENILKALNALFSIKTEYSDGLYNAMYQSDLRAKKVEMKGTTAFIYTHGTVVKPKEDCDKERYRVQVWATAEYFTAVNHAIIYANNALLGDLLEQGGKK